MVGIKSYFLELTYRPSLRRLIIPGITFQAEKYKPSNKLFFVTLYRPTRRFTYILMQNYRISSITFNIHDIIETLFRTEFHVFFSLLDVYIPHKEEIFLFVNNKHAFSRINGYTYIPPLLFELHYLKKKKNYT